ncbi:MAG: hypothetical protein AB1567_04570 [bacterium]
MLFHQQRKVQEIENKVKDIVAIHSKGSPKQIIKAIKGEITKEKLIDAFESAEVGLTAKYIGKIIREEVDNFIALGNELAKGCNYAMRIKWMEVWIKVMELLCRLRGDIAERNLVIAQQLNVAKEEERSGRFEDYILGIAQEEKSDESTN